MAKIAVGSKINLNGAVRVLDSKQLKTLKFATGPSNYSNNPPALSTLKQWISGGGGGPTWVSNSSSTYYPQWGSLPQTNEIDAFPNQDAINLLGITGLYSLDSNGNFVIQPRLLTANELNTVHASGYPAPKWLSGSVVTLPYGIAPPFLFGARVQLPTPMVPGLWPAVWLLKPQGGWPPEMDILEAVAPNGTLQPTTTMHSSDTNNYPSGQSGTIGPTVGDANTKTFHDYWVVMYNDYTTTFYDGVAVASFVTPSDWQNQMAYMIINYAIAGSGNWPGPLNPSTTSLPPMIIADAIACQMPATYGQGTAISYVGPSGPSAISFGGVTPTAPTGPSSPTGPSGGLKQPESANTTIILPGVMVAPIITDSYGDTWGLNAAGVILKNGVADAKTNSVTELSYNNHKVYQAAYGYWWYWDHPTSTWIASAAP